MRKAVCTLAMIVAGAAMATAQNWFINGNGNLTDTSKLGSKNNKSVRFVTNNLERMILERGSGYLGIGVSNPEVVLDVSNANDSHVFKMNSAYGNMFASIYEQGIYRGYWGSYSGNPQDVDFGTGIGNNSGKLHLTIQASPMATLDSAGRFGIGTTTPQSKLDVSGNINGRTTFTTYNADGFASSVQQGLKIINPNGNDWMDVGYYSTGGGEYPTALRFYSPNGLNARNAFDRPFLFRTQGANVQLGMYNDGSARFGGNVGVFPTTTDVSSRLPVRELEVDGNIRLSRNQSSGARYLEFVNTAVGKNDWRFDYYFAGSGALYIASSTDDFVSNSSDRAKFDTGFYKFTVYGNALATGIWQNSDGRLKKDIKDLPNATDLINKLKPHTYHFKTDDYNAMNLPRESQFGFIAQEVEQVLPELVHTEKQLTKRDLAGERVFEEVKSVNYIELIPILTKALQEQNDRIEKLEAMVTSLQQASSVAKTSNENVKASSASLAQNIPNPFSKQTSIAYSIPTGFSSAQLVITDNSGRTIQQTQITKSGNGVVHFDASQLSSGTYYYTLIIDGKTAENRKMMVTK
jgi:hypothetical protein